MGNKFIEKLFYFLERPPAAREHEWEHHRVSLGLGINHRGRGKEVREATGPVAAPPTAPVAASNAATRARTTPEPPTPPIGGGGGGGGRPPQPLPEATGEVPPVGTATGEVGAATTAVGRRIGRKPPMM
jgi:hypothetical protein